MIAQRKMRALPTVLLLLVLVAGLARPADAGGGAFCSNPFIFEGSEVNIVVVPYSLRAPDRAFRQQTSMNDLSKSRIAQKLSVLIQLDTLYSLSYPAGMGVVHIIPDIPNCTAERVLAQVEPQLQDGKGLILLWGHFIEEGEQIYVQSYLRFLRKGRSEALGLRLRGTGDSMLTGEPAQQAIGFAPRLIGEEDIAALEAAFEEATIIYEDSAGTEEAGRLQFHLERPLAYYVDAIDPESGRMHVRPHKFVGGPEGWIAARTNPEVWPLRRRLPELIFTNAVAGYLAARIIEESQQDLDWAGPWQRRLEIAGRRSRMQFDEYRGTIAEDSDARDSFDEKNAVALSYSLAGLLELQAAGQDGAADHLETAERLFALAVRLAPFQPAARNLQAMALAGLAGLRDDASASRAVKAWSTALSLDPGNEMAAGNLAAFYKRLLQSDPAASGLTSDEIRARLASLDAVRSGN